MFVCLCLSLYVCLRVSGCFRVYVSDHFSVCKCHCVFVSVRVSLCACAFVRRCACVTTNVHVSMCVSVRLLVCLSGCICGCLCVLLCLCACLGLPINVSQYVSLCVFLYVCVSARVFLYMCASLSAKHVAICMGDRLGITQLQNKADQHVIRPAGMQKNSKDTKPRDAYSNLFTAPEHGNPFDRGASFCKRTFAKNETRNIQMSRTSRALAASTAPKRERIAKSKYVQNQTTEYLSHTRGVLEPDIHIPGNPAFHKPSFSISGGRGTHLGLPWMRLKT